MSEFHFSPRANRASEIAWQTWNESAFARAASENKPVLLSISAVWCHWCHVMDETAYSDDRVISLINERYVPIRVDNDRRPDINARYNQGGWPTTAFLAPDGTLLAGATYLPADQMAQALQEIDRFYRERQTQIEERAAQMRVREPQAATGAREELNGSIMATVLAAVRERYDEEYGGFGDAPKFPMTDVLEFALQEYRCSGDAALYDIVAATLLAMSRGGTYDHVEGGFFRYSTTRDWSVPHFEKMAEDHAGLLRVLAFLYAAGHNDAFRDILRSALHYVRSTLRDPKSGLFAGSQDADETYYALPLDERRALRAPYVDRTSYSNWTSAIAGAFFVAAWATDDDVLQREGEQTLDTMHETLRDADGLLYHFVEPGGAPQVRGLLTDQAAYLRALLDAHEYSGESRFLDRAVQIAEAIEARFAAESGGYYDHAAIEGELGALQFRDRPLDLNASIAESFLRLSVLLHDDRLRERAEAALLVYTQTYANAGTFAAPYARAVRRYVDGGASAEIVGSAGDTAELREAAHRLPDPLLVVRTTAPNGDGRPKGSAYVCVGMTCAPPVTSAGDLRGAYESVKR
jgi:uncharacterized protein YyaL (SSP411 family)